MLLHAGTNDVGVTPDAPQQLTKLVDKILSQCPDATVLVATIMHRGDADIDAKTIDYNNEVRKIVDARQGQHVYLVDQYSAILPGDPVDRIHPTPAGYDKMAEVWSTAIQQVIGMGLIQDPVAGTGGPGMRQTCTGTLFWNPFGELLNGGALGADLDQDGAHAVQFADLNADGRDDFIWIGPNGEVTAYVNGGPAADGHWIWYPQPSNIAGGVGGERGEIHFADLTGDGRAEYLWVHPDGSVDVWLNQQQSTETASTLAINWLPQTRSAGGIGRNGAGVRFADLNADGRAEYIYVQDDGSLIIYLNTGSQDNGPNAGVINWSLQTQTPAILAATRDEVVLADIDGDGRSDYLKVSSTDGSVIESMNGGGQDTGSNTAVVN